MNHLTSLRDYIDALAKIGEIQPIDQEVDWNLEMGAIIRRSYDLKAPAPLFNTITGIEHGFRALGAPGGVSRQPGLYLSRVALSLGLEPRARGQEIIEALAAARGRTPIPPREVATGPCKDHVLVGDKVDLLRLPAPFIHSGDGGRYLNTYGVIIVRTPDKRWTNWSISRIMVVDKTRMTGLVVPNQHLGMIHAEWQKIGQPTPFALALGTEPFIPFVGGMPLPSGVDEADYTGAYFGEPVEVVRCETVDLQVPATAEIVIEGFLSHEETAMEGPMGEYAGYVAPGPGTPKPVYRVTAMTHRTDPILPVVAAGEPVEEDHTAWGLPHAGELLYELRGLGLPVTMCWMTLETACHWLVVTVAQDWRQTTHLDSPALIRQVGDIVFGSKAGFGIPKVLLMEDDVDATNTDEVIWAFATRCHPVIGEVAFGHEATTNLPVFLDSKEKLEFLTTKAVYNCLSHDDWTPETAPKRTSFRALWPAEIQEKVLRNWRAYGYT